GEWKPMVSWLGRAWTRGVPCAADCKLCSPLISAERCKRCSLTNQLPGVRFAPRNASKHLHTLEPPKPNPTRQRLLDAAFSICAQRGLHGATTREIAEAAEVNEVTLFRHFGSKEKLIAALFERSV